jgi:disulfide oxidoreductase YuzD
MNPSSLMRGLAGFGLLPCLSLLLSCSLTLLVGCSEGGRPPPSCASGECGVDAGPSPAASTVLDAGRRDAAVKKGSFVVTDASDPGELQARMVVNGANVACGSCAVLVVQAQGGKQPYKYEWSDPTLSGPGPQHVCPSAPTSYSVTVTDNSATSAGEFAQVAMEVEASGSVSCVPDAGVTDDLQGCITPTPIVSDAGTEGGDAGSYGAGIQCGDGGVAFDLDNGTTGDVTVSTKIADAFSNFSVFKAGHTYTYIADRFLPLVLSLNKPVLVDVYGAATHCALTDKLFTLQYDLLTWHQAFCFTPKVDYAYIVVAVHLNGVVFFFDLLDSASICSGCTE